MSVRRTRHWWSGRRQRPVLAAVAVMTALSVVMSLAGPSPAFAAPSAGQARTLPPTPTQVDHVVSGRTATPVPYSADPAAAHALKGAPAAPVWPAAGAAVVDVPAVPSGLRSPAVAAHVAASMVRAGALPVRLSATTSARMSVSVLDRATAPTAYRDGVLLRLSRIDGTATADPVHLSVDYSGFRTAYGGDWASRLHLVALPDCALKTPAATGCQGTPVPSTNNVAAGTVTADVVVPAATAAAATTPATATPAAIPAVTTFAVTAGASGAAGNFGATSLASAGAWSAGGSSGDFSWSYQMRVPPALGGPVPQLALSYSAQSVDGEMAASNNQPSWAGEGFQFAPGGYIERRYKTCADDMDGSANNSTKTGDQCWGTDNATLSLNGSVVELIKDGATGTWRPRTDDGSKIEHLTGGTNGDDNGEYWKVTTANGTQYWFGRNHLPGWAAGKPETNSVWTVPVFGNNPGEPCHQTTFDASWCNQAWRWNLDHVVDPHGNSMSFRYTAESNKYARDIDPTKVSGYTRAGYLTEIDYGTRADSEYGTAPMRVLLNVADRCTPGATCDTAHPSSWPDVPWDQSCTGTTCTQYSPTFFTTKRLASVKTQVWNGSNAYRDVDNWTLTHSYPDPGDGTRAGLWLAKISHAGLVGGTTTVPDVTFTGVQMANRVDTIDASPAMNWWRVASIRTETGGEISVNYAKPDCVAGSRMPSAPESNTLRCYPVNWTPLGSTDPIRDWFHKYVVTAVAEVDHTGGAPRVLTSYDYVGDPAWHYTDDDGLIAAKNKTWSVWRGYGTVRTTLGDPGEQSYGETRYFRGMDGDHLPSGTRSVTIADTRGGTFPDADPYAGRVREQLTYNGPGGAVVSELLTDPWMSAPTATRTIDGVTVNARYVNTAASSQRIGLDGGRGWLTTKTATTYDAYGMAVTNTDYGDVNTSGDEQCTKYSYARNTSMWLLNYTSRIQTYAGTCDKDPTSADAVIGDARNSYDGQAAGAVPTKGDVTRVEALKDWSAGNTTYLTTSRSAYDTYGRLTDSWDVDGNHSTTGYTPSSGGPVTRTTGTNPLGWSTTTDVEPAWGATTGTTDQNGRRTDVTYDALGRTTAVWLPGRPKATQSANTTYAYTLSTTAPNVVTTAKLNPKGTYTTSYLLSDGLLRARQAQAPAVGSNGGSSGGGLVTDTFYDSAGRAYKSNAAYVIAAAPSATLFNPAGDTAIAAQTLTLFDGADRPVASVLRSFGAELWRTTSAYGGDHTDVTPPAGGLATSTIIDARGRTVALRRFHGQTPTGPYDTTTYTFNAKNLPAAVVDTAGNTWRYGYDVRGRATSTSDPDKGTTTAAYDDAGRVVSTTDARGHTLAYTYDILSRQTAEYDGSVAGTKLAEWAYDTLVKGEPTSSTRYVGTDAYTTASTGYTTGYQPTGTQVTVPLGEGLLAGTYKFGATYAVDGTPSTVTMPATADLPQETLGYTYATTGQSLTLTGTTTYVTDAQYTRLGEPAKLTYSTGGPLAQTSMTYDETTRRLVRTLDVRSTVPSTIADENLTWTPAGDVTKIANTPDGGTADTQCFGYDDHRRLASAWTPASGDCATGASPGNLGGPAPYWQSFAYDAVGNRLAKTDHATTAGTADTTTAYAYPAPGTAQPHTLSSTTTTDSTGTRTVAYAYDAAGNTTTRPTATGTQTLTWDAEGHPATVTDPASAGSASYLYDADGNRLIRRDAGGSTLYLPGEEVRAATGAATATCTRYYSFDGTTIGQRTAGGVTWLMPDRQGTAQIAVTADNQQVTQRRQKPFGEPRGSSVTWPNSHGYVGGTNDPDGLTHLGARDYDPSTGRFTSVDPVFDGSDPAQMVGYGYSGGSPITQSDPSGLTYGCDSSSHDRCGDPGMGSSGCGDCRTDPPAGGGGKGGGGGGGGGSGGGGGGGGYTDTSGYYPPVSAPAPPAPAPAPQCSWFCGVTQVFTKAVNWVEQNKAQIAGIAVGIAVGIGCGALIGWTGVGAIACGALAGAAGSLTADLVEGGHSAGSLVGDTLMGGLTGALGALGGELLGAGLKAAAPALRAGVGKLLGKATTEVEDIAVDSAQNLGAKVNCITNSFAAGTAVLMADGSSKPIEQVATGDEVRAEDPTTGASGSRAVTATITGQGLKQLVDVTIALPDESGQKSEHLSATDGHPLWVVNRSAWVTAGDLVPGDRLVTASGQQVPVRSIRHQMEIRRVYNLSVDGLHTYYVMAGNTPVLVHNCGMVDSSTVRFSQKGVSQNFKDGRSVTDLADTLRSDANYGRTVKPIRLVDRDGDMFTLDNRRLVAFQMADEPVPFRMATAREIRRESWKFDTKVDGLGINVRGWGWWGGGR